MDKLKLIVMGYQIANLHYPSDEVTELLLNLSHDRILELMLVMRQSSRPIKSPVNFLRRAINEGWSAETMPRKINRIRYENEIKIYQQLGYTLEEARKQAYENQQT